MVVMRLPPCIAASIMQERTRRPSTCTVQAPHSPRSQPFFVPVNASCSRKASSSARLDRDGARLAVDLQFYSHALQGLAHGALAHGALARATSAALIPSNASPSVTPSSMMRRSFWVIAMRV
jgi:hypothetical protein